MYALKQLETLLSLVGEAFFLSQLLGYTVTYVLINAQIILETLCKK